MKISNVLVKLLIIVFWILIIFCCLYLPNYISRNISQKSINIYSWPDMFNSYAVSQFEKETGIKVNISYYESNEELIIKLKATEGTGYDLVIPSDYTVDILRKENLLKQLDKTKLNFWGNLNTKLLNHFFDPNNIYSIPYEWAIFGIGINKNILKTENFEKSWNLIFEPEKLKNKLVMTNDPLVGIPIAALYLFGSVKDITIEKLEKIKSLLIKQRSYVTAYSDSRPDYYLATQNAGLAIASSSYIWRTIKKYPFIDFIIPQEGTLITIESFVALKNSTKDDLIYKFLNFMYRPEILADNFKELAFFPTTVDSIELLQDQNTKIPDLLISFDKIKNLEFFRMSYFKKPVTEETIQDSWINIKL